MAASIDQDALDDLLARAGREVDQGLLPACQVAVAKDGELVAFEAYGQATTDTRFVVFSCTKAVTAGAVWSLVGEGRLDPADRVVDHVPSFTGDGKERVTLEHLLTHTAGFPYAPLGGPEAADRQARLARMASWRTTWEPGERYEYHATSAHWVVAEVIEAVTGRDFRLELRERVLDPLGLDGFRVGLLGEHDRPTATLVGVGERPTPEQVEEATGIPGVDLSALGIAEDLLLALNAPEAQEVGIPGGGGVGTAADLALLYQGFLQNPDDLWDPTVLADGTGNVRCTLPDPLWGRPANRTLGLVKRGDDEHAGARGIGGVASSGEAFGHGGAGGQHAWADPASGLSFGYVTNGLDRDLIREYRRVAGINHRASKVAPGQAV